MHVAVEKSPLKSRATTSKERETKLDLAFMGTKEISNN
jgi:hypothetical protein